MEVFRGGALDIGFCHEDPNRSSLTFEMWFFVPPSDAWLEKAASSGGGSGSRVADVDEEEDEDGEEEDASSRKQAAPLPFHVPQTLAVRTLVAREGGGSGGGEEKSLDMWSLRLQPSGSLVVQLIHQDDVPTSQPFSGDIIKPRVERNKDSSSPKSHFSTNTGVISAGKWHHIALTLNSRRYLAWNPESPTQPQTCDVTIFVDGEKVQTEVAIVFVTSVFRVLFAFLLLFFVGN
jgi:hypothetical protein